MNDPISDQHLVNFLKQNSPTIPDSAPNLEQEVMAAIERESWREQARGNVQNSPSKIPNRLWLIPPALAAGLLVSWSGYHLLTPATSSVAEEEHLEAFLVNNWEVVVGENQGDRQRDRELEWFSVTSPKDSQLQTNN